MSGLRNALGQIGRDRREWAGVPMPMDGSPMTVERTYPDAEKIMAMGRKETPEDIEEADYAKGVTIRNRFWSVTRRQHVTVWEKDGKIEWGVQGFHNSLDKMLSTLAASDAWGIMQEKAAIDTLGTMLRHRQFKQYLLTGMFMESSKRSGVHYLFRRLRPTVAITTKGERLRVLAALCLHPIGYYDDSWAGAMCPTDDVLAHLALMRGDEAMFWRRANQHAAHEPSAGIF